MSERTVVVTGATDGLGRAVARAFAAAGDDLVVGGRDAERLEEATTSLSGDATGVRTDPRDEYDLERLLETAARFGDSGVDVVVPCDQVAHEPPGAAPLPETSYAAFDDTVRTNARGTFSTVREALPHMPADGRVVVPTAPAGRGDATGQGAYGVSLAAVEAVVRGFAADCEQVVGGIDAGRPTVEEDGDGPSDERVAEAVRWAATEADPETLDGAVVAVDEWQATAE